MSPDELVEYCRRRVREADFRRWAVELLADLVDIDTAIKPDVEALAAGERAVTGRISAELKRFCGDRVRLEVQPIDPAIADDPYFSQLYYTRTADRPAGLGIEECYRGRGNLLALFEGEVGAGGAGPPGRPCVWNAHVDTVAPFMPASVEAGRVTGRGSVDDKAAVVMLIAQARLLAECRERLGLRLAADRACQFVIEEEMGGNGSLSAVRDRRFAGWPVVVGEATGNLPHPANRGAVWFAVEMDGSADPRINLVELAAHVVLALEGAGRKLKAESDHPLFRREHVQTCHGILGPHGRHPSAVNDYVPLMLTPAGKVTPGRLAALRQVLELGLSEYVARYGDKSKEIDEGGNPKVRAHFELDVKPPVVVKVFGKAGHMGAIHTLDCAIIKAAFLVAAVMQLNEEAGEPFWTIGLVDVPAGQRRLVLEGGQGFVPTHEMEEVQARLRGAAERGAREYVESSGIAKPRDDSPGATLRENHPWALTRTTFEKLHNAAFACPVDSPPMQTMEQAFAALGRDWPAPAGWAVSCDARIFAREGHPVVTFGPGDLRQAHSDQEFVEADELLDAITISTLTAVAISNGRL